MIIKGIYGDQNAWLSTEQWVNVYVEQADRPIYLTCMQVKDMSSWEDYEDFMLEPVTEEGQLMELNSCLAITNGEEPTITIVKDYCDPLSRLKISEKTYNTCSFGVMCAS